jgi:hypothetical protein
MAKSVFRIKLPQYTITQAFSLKYLSHITQGDALGFYTPGFQPDEKAFNYLL